MNERTLLMLIALMLAHHLYGECGCKTCGKINSLLGRLARLENGGLRAEIGGSEMDQLLRDIFE